MNLEFAAWSTLVTLVQFVRFGFLCGKDFPCVKDGTPAGRRLQGGLKLCPGEIGEM